MGKKKLLFLLFTYIGHVRIRKVEFNQKNVFFLMLYYFYSIFSFIFIILLILFIFISIFSFSSKNEMNFKNSFQYNFVNENHASMINFIHDIYRIQQQN